MKKFKKLVIIIILLIAALAAAFFWGMNKQKEMSKPVVTNELLTNRIQLIAELATTSYHYTNMGQFENSNTFYGYQVPFTMKKFIISYDGEIKAGVDIKDSEIKVDDKKIIVKIPEAKILSHEIDENSIQIFDEVSSIFNPIKIDDMSSFTKDQKAKVEKNAIEKGLLTEARDSCEKFISKMLLVDSEILGGYTIEFK